MQSTAETAATSNKMLWIGRIISAILALFLLFDSAMKFVKPAIVVETTVKLGYPENLISVLGIVLLVCTLAYVIPQTSILGAILLTGYLGGAVASHLRAGDPLFAVFFPVVFGMLLWGGLFLRDARLSALIPLRR
ncbi:MAG TPA: DoxX family protein [Pirellulales bacterium]|nr:DoxX family protein [Pirellulales bacterium]